MSEAVCQAVTSAGKPCRARPLRSESFCALHMPGADPRAMGARGGRARGKQAQLEPLTDRERAKAALLRALEGGNYAAAVAAAKAIFDEDPRDPLAGTVTVEDARAQLNAKLDSILDHRRRSGETCPVCSGSGYVLVAPRPEGAAGDRGAPPTVLFLIEPEPFTWLTAALLRRVQGAAWAPC